jgi:hypothetical protein
MYRYSTCNEWEYQFLLDNPDCPIVLKDVECAVASVEPFPDVEGLYRITAIVLEDEVTA